MSLVQEGIADLTGINYFTALEELVCIANLVTILDVSSLSRLETLNCLNNRLVTLNVSGCNALKELFCQKNELTSLDLSLCPQLERVYCYHNQIRENGMDKLVESLRNCVGGILVVADDSSEESNLCNTDHVSTANNKGWTVYACKWDDELSWKVYEGCDSPEMAPVALGDNFVFGTAIDTDTDLDGNVVGSVLFNIGAGEGSYSPAEGCIVLNKATDDAAFDGKNIFGDDFRDSFTGIVFKVPAGNGLLEVEAQTQGNMVLKVKIGDNAPKEVQLDGKQKASFYYSLAEDSYAYIYAGSKTAASKGVFRAAGTDALKIYGIGVLGSVDGIQTIAGGESASNRLPVYSLGGQRVNTPTKGVYVRNGQKVVLKH